MRSLLTLCFVLAVVMFGCKGEDAKTPEGKTAEVKTPEVTTPEVKTPEVTTPEVTTKAIPISLEVGCAKCVYKVEGTTACAPAAKVADKVVLLEGTGVDAKTLMDKGCCKAALTAEAVGKVDAGKFVATSFTLKEK